MLNDFTFCPIALQISENEIQTMLGEVRSVSDNFWYRDEFRGCHMLPIYNGGGQCGPTNNHDRPFHWSPAGQACPQTAKILETRVFPHLIPHGRTTILRTPPNGHLNVHIDCNAEQVGTRQHKLRLVLNGAIDRLFFLNDKLERVYIPSGHKSYVIDGSHPHGLEASSLEKITICVGMPWNGDLNPDLAPVLNMKDSLKVSRPRTLNQEWFNPIWTRGEHGRTF